jgi:hypothetical protein
MKLTISVFFISFVSFANSSDFPRVVYTAREIVPVKAKIKDPRDYSNRPRVTYRSEKEENKEVDEGLDQLEAEAESLDSLEISAREESAS